MCTLALNSLQIRTLGPTYILVGYSTVMYGFSDGVWGFECFQAFRISGLGLLKLAFGMYQSI